MAEGLQNIGNILSGFGAGVQGRGPEFLRGLEDKKQRRIELSKERKQAGLQDVSIALDHLNNGRVGQAFSLFQNRNDALSQIEGADNSDTLGILNKFQEGKIDELKSEFETIVNEGQQRGLLAAPEGAKFLERSGGQAFFQQPSGEITTQDIEGFSADPTKPQIKAGVNEAGEDAFFAITPAGATEITGARPSKKSPLVQVGGAGGKEQEELAKLRAKRLTTLRERGDQAEQQITSLDILENIDVSTGAAEPMKQAIANFAEGLGIDASKLANVAAGQAFTGEAGKLVLRIMSTQKGPQTENDRRNIAKTISRLGNRPEANAFINNAARSLANRSIEQRDFFNEWLDQNDTLKGAARSWNKQKADVPMVSRSVKTPEGLPVFFFRFENRVREANPDATKEQIIEAWKRQEQAARARK